MNQYLKLSLLFGISLQAQVSNAFTLNLDVSGSDINYDNAISLSGTKYVTSDWQAISNLEPTYNWQPALATNASTLFIATSPEGTKVEIPITITGIQYNLGGADNIEQEAPLFSGPSCGSLTGVNGDIVTVDADVSSGVGHSEGDCQTDFSIYEAGGANVQPFYFIRPIVEIDEEQLIENLESAGISQSGKIIGTVPLALRYAYRNSSSAVLTYRHVGIQSFSVQIDYTPSELTSIRADRIRTIDPEYDTAAHTASGETEFNIQANGIFQTGLRMTFQVGKDYSMKRITSTNPEETPTFNSEDKIPYYIRCDMCDVNHIVEDGVLQSDAETSVVVGEEAGSTDQINFTFAVGYENLAAEDTLSGFYQDTFTVIFEENL